jgi:hypothetical protein
MTSDLKIFAFCLATILQPLGAQPTLTPREVIKNARKYVYVIHGGVQAHAITNLILRYGDTRMVTVAADRREYVEEFIDAGFEVWTSDDGTNTMRHKKSSIIVDGKYLIDYAGNVTEDSHKADVLRWEFDRFWQNYAKLQKPRPKKKAPAAKEVKRG